MKKALTQAPLLTERMSEWLKEWVEWVRATFPFCSLLWLMALWELRASGSWMWVGGFEEQDHRGNTKQQECILEGQVRLTLKVAIQSYALSTAYCAGFLWRHVIKERFMANIHGLMHIYVNVTVGFAGINSWVKLLFFLLWWIINVRYWNHILLYPNKK